MKKPTGNWQSNVWLELLGSYGQSSRTLWSWRKGCPSSLVRLFLVILDCSTFHLLSCRVFQSSSKCLLDKPYFLNKKMSRTLFCRFLIFLYCLRNKKNWNHVKILSTLLATGLFGKLFINLFAVDSFSRHLYRKHRQQALHQPHKCHL